ncbi:MAG: carboxymuconolactone decarboxylase family protein [Oscillochloris sp.]|nr:carboxymuconolactone decarboxylase family protein [Oscillochloris sp.]
MSRIPLVRREDAPPEIQAEYDTIVREHRVVTNMKATLLHSPVALHAVLEWYTLFDRVKPLLGERLAILFCHAISRQNACELCLTFMRRDIIKGGEDPENLVLDERERAVVEFGRQLAADPNHVSDALYAQLTQYFDHTQIVDLTVFGALMIVNNIVNSALQVDLDESLNPYRIQPEQILG